MQGEGEGPKAMSLLLKELDPEIMSVRPPVRVKHVLAKRYHRKRLYELSLKSIGEIPQLEDPNEEQNERIERRMHGSAKSWEVWDQK